MRVVHLPTSSSRMKAYFTTAPARSTLPLFLDIFLKRQFAHLGLELTGFNSHRGNETRSFWQVQSCRLGVSVIRVEVHTSAPDLLTSLPNPR